jgi:RNA polymerase sigma-70 factor (ECF subfamily)
MPLDEELVTAIYREHGPALRRFVLGATSSPHQVEDVVQETVLRVWRQGPDITGNLRSYLFRTARNVMIDNYRRTQRRPQEARRPPDSEDGPGWEPPPDTGRIDGLLDRVLMEEALQRLSAAHRDVVVALHYRRFTIAEAAVQLNLPTGTVKSRAFYAIKALRTILEEMGVEP